MENAIIVLDIGKTNKKLFAYSERLEILEFSYVKIDTLFRDGLQIENSRALLDWLFENLKMLTRKYRVRVISVTAHGATCACVGDDGLEPVIPVVAYTNEVAPSVHESFFAAAGRRNDLQSRTGTAAIGPLANLAVLVSFMKSRFPEGFAKATKLLPYPQYVGYALTGKCGIEYTYVGCHTYLWDFVKWDWSDVVDALGIRNMLPARPSFPGDVLGRVRQSVCAATGLPSDTLVMTGIHDSNSSLLPYLVSSGESDFVVNSTGTWCVLMHPGEPYGFSPDELGKTVLFNISAGGNPVKTAVFMGGQEFETWVRILQTLHGRTDFLPYDLEAARAIAREKNLFILPGVVPGAGQFPASRPMVVEADRSFPLESVRSGESVPASFSSYVEAYTCLILSIAIQTAVALSRVNLRPGTKIFVEGGFRNNEAYLTALASLFPHNQVFITRMEEATAFGAALLGKAAIDRTTYRNLREYCAIEKRRVYPKETEGLEAYMKAFLETVKSNEETDHNGH